MEPTATAINPASTHAGARPALSRGATLDRYVVLNVLGSGGMGVVYAAFDPQLDRRVALKLVRPGRASSRSHQETQQRLAREAQALAKLNHPHVLAVHDVGSVGGQLFVATELVEGVDLGAWLRRRRRSRGEILAMFQQAGSGLAAAHDAGLVHRDVKPSNVMVGDDGRARVVDFGLVRVGIPRISTTTTDVATRETEPGPARGATDLSASSVLGTPTYAAPEQLAGETATAAADQFSFCVALFRALCDVPPFAPTAVRRPDVPAAWTLDEAALQQLPARLRPIVRRGLSFAPGDRYPSMTALLTDLEASRSHRRRLRYVAALLALAMGAGLAVWGTSAVRQSQLCSGGEARFDAVWSPPRRQAIADAFERTGLTYAEASWRSVSLALDRFGEAWAGMHRQACRATAVEGTQSSTLLDRRMACLDQRLSEVDALAQLLARGAVVEGAVEAASALPSVDQCADAASLLAQVPPPDDAQGRREAARLRPLLAMAEARLLTGDYAAGYEQAIDLVAGTEALGYWPLVAEALLLRGRFEEQLGRPRDADATLARALEAAQAGGHERVAAETFVRRVRVTGYQQADFVRGTRYAEQATAALARLTRADDLAAVLAGNRGALLGEQGEFDAALVAHRRALTFWRRMKGEDDPQTGIALTRVGDVLLEQGMLAAAAEHYTGALDISRDRYGEQHPLTARLLSKLGTVLLEQGMVPEAQARFEQALAASRASLGEDHPYIVTPLTYLGHALVARGAYDEAVGRYREALAILQADAQPDAEPDDRRLAVVASGLGRAASSAGDLDQAEASYRQALSLRERVYGKDHPAVAETAFNLGEVAKKQGDFGSALEQYRRALDIWQATQPDNAFLIAVGLTGVGEGLLGTGESVQAVLVLNRALDLHPTGRDPGFLAATQFALAQALAVAGGERARARQLAEAARQGYSQGRAAARDELVRVEAWLNDHPPLP